MDIGKALLNQIRRCNVPAPAKLMMSSHQYHFPGTGRYDRIRLLLGSVYVSAHELKSLSRQLAIARLPLRQDGAIFD